MSMDRATRHNLSAALGASCPETLCRNRRKRRTPRGSGWRRAGSPLCRSFWTRARQVAAVSRMRSQQPRRWMARRLLALPERVVVRVLCQRPRRWQAAQVTVVRSLVVVLGTTIVLLVRQPLNGHGTTALLRLVSQPPSHMQLSHMLPSHMQPGHVQGSSQGRAGGRRQRGHRRSAGCSGCQHSRKSSHRRRHCGWGCVRGRCSGGCAPGMPFSFQTGRRRVILHWRRRVEAEVGGWGLVGGGLGLVDGGWRRRQHSLGHHRVGRWRQLWAPPVCAGAAGSGAVGWRRWRARPHCRLRLVRPRCPAAPPPTSATS